MPDFYGLVPQQPYEDRRATIERTEAMGVNPTEVTGFTTVGGAGEVAVDVNFPVVFVEKPGMSFGGELAPNNPPEATNFPTVSVVVLNWRTIERPTDDLYIGARLGVVTTGKTDHQMIIHWHAHGKALRNPAGGGPSGGATTDTPI